MTVFIISKELKGQYHGWPHQYVHNHAATNGLALYIAGKYENIISAQTKYIFEYLIFNHLKYLGLVLTENINLIDSETLSLDEVFKSAENIKNMGAVICERALKLLENVVDGSLEEGVSYGKESKINITNLRIQNLFFNMCNLVYIMGL